MTALLTGTASAMCRAEEIDHTGRSRLRLRGRLPDTTADPGTVRGRLVLTDRFGGDERRVPLRVADAEHSRFDAELDLASGGLALYETIWDLYAETSADDAKPHRWRVTGDLVRRAGEEFTSIRAYGDHRYRPFITLRGGVSVKVRGLAGHVELGEVWTHPDRVELTGSLIRNGGRDASGAMLARRHTDGAAVELPTTWRGDRLTMVLDPATLASHDRDPRLRDHTQWWELLLPFSGRELPLGRFLDDVHPKEKIMVFPCREVGSPPARAIKPCFTAYDTLVIESMPPAAPVRSAA